jgi:hypothetical protein
MTRSQWMAFGALLLLLVVGTAIHWFIPWSGPSIQANAISYLVFVATLVGFAATIYQLQETERSIQESAEKPALELEVLPAEGEPGMYSSTATHELELRPLDDDGSRIGARFALGISNHGRKTASRVFLTFVFQSSERSSDSATEKLTVLPAKMVKSVGGSHDFPLAIYADADVRAGQWLGWTLRFPADFVVYPDSVDRPIVAQLNLVLAKKDFRPNWEIHYRIHSLEGNSRLHESTDSRTDSMSDQIYQIVLSRTDSLETRSVISNSAFTVSSARVTTDDRPSISLPVAISRNFDIVGPVGPVVRDKFSFQTDTDTNTPLEDTSE